MAATSQRTLCTGAAGFIGSHLVRALLDRGDEVWGLLGPDDAPDPAIGSAVTWIRGDLTRPDTLDELRRPFTTVYHLAGLLTSSDEDQLFLVNFEGTRNLVEALTTQSLPPRLVFASSLAAGGPAARRSGRSEDEPSCPVSPYGRSKRMAELYLQAIGARVPTTIVRLPLVYGPGSGGGLFAYFRMVRMRCCFIGGKTVAFTLGYVGDVVRGLLLLGSDDATAGGTYCLGDPRPYQLPEIIAAIEAALKRRALRIHIPWLIGYWGTALVEALAAARGREPAVSRQDLDGFLRFPYWIANTAKVEREVGFSPATSLGEGVELAAAWYRQRGWI